VREDQLDPTRPKILWLHDLAQDPEAQHLKDPNSRNRFAKLVFVSDWQLQQYSNFLGVPYAESLVLKNAIEPIEVESKPEGPTRIIYHTTPHRGLEILVPVFDKIYRDINPNIELEIYSSFEIYGWPQRDEPFKPLMEFCEQHPAITFHGARSNAEVREGLKRAHIFAYPSVWLETSCIAAMEAMSAGCHIVCPNYGALPETCANFAHMYQWSQDVNQHANMFARWLVNAIELSEKERFDDRLKFQKAYADTLYNWDVRTLQWSAVLQNIINSIKKSD
jgi:glycosyltransferase involved in cell wall biosynthesis